MVDTDEIGFVDDVVDEVIERRLPIPSEKRWEPDCTDDAAGVGDSLDQFILDIAAVILHGAGIGMSDDNRSVRRFDRIHAGTMSGV